MNLIEAARAPKGYDAQRISRRRVPRRTGIALILLALWLALILLIRSSQTTTAATDECYRAAAQKSLAKLCSTYDCPSSAEPTQSYTESALSRIRFLAQPQFAELIDPDEIPEEKVVALTIGSELVSWTYFNLGALENAQPERRCQLTEESLDHEAIHQAAALIIFPEPLSLNFFNRSVVAAGSTGLSLFDSQSAVHLHYINEAYTEWLALGLRRSSFSDPLLIPIYQTGPKVVGVLNAKMGLQAKTVFDLYVNRGLYGFVPHFAKLSGPVLVKEYGSEDQSGLALLFYTDFILSEVARGDYSEGEALRRIFEFTDSPNASVRK